MFLGDKSVILDPDNADLELYPLYSKATQYRATLQAGDVIFIPGRLVKLYSCSFYHIWININ